MTANAMEETPYSASGQWRRERQGPRDDQTAASKVGSDDQEQIARFLRGEPAAVETVSLWLKQAAGRYRGRLSTEWDDLIQDLLLEVTVALQDGAFRGDSQLQTFVWRIAHYRCLNRMRDLARRPENAHEERAQQVPDPTRPVLDRIMERESADLLRHFLETMPDLCRRLWRLILAGRSYREISGETGVSEGALRVRVLRCRRQAVSLWKTLLEESND